MWIQPLLFKAETLRKEHIRRYQGCYNAVQSHLSLTRHLYLDLVEVLASFKRDHVVGGDAGDGFICGILGFVKRQCCLTRNYLPSKHQQLKFCSEYDPKLNPNNKRY